MKYLTKATFFDEIISLKETTQPTIILIHENEVLKFSASVDFCRLFSKNIRDLKGSYFQRKNNQLNARGDPAPLPQLYIYRVIQSKLDFLN